MDEAAWGLPQRFRALRGEKSQGAVANRLGIDRTRISKIENGALPSVVECAKYDGAFDTGGELTDLRRTVVAAQEVKGVSPTDRRQALTGLAAVGMAALDISKATAATSADRATVRELTADVWELATAYTTTPHAQLEPLGIRRWQQIQNTLPTALGDVRQEYERLFGQYSYFLGRLAFNNGDLRTAGRLAGTALQYSQASGDEILVGSSAALLSSIDYCDRQYEPAATLAAWARVNANHPYLAPRLAGYHGRCLARLGDTEGVISAIGTIETGTYHAEISPGSSPYTPEVASRQMAGLWADIGQGERAEGIAREALRDGDPNRFEERGLAFLALAHSLRNRRAPVVDEAALSVVQAIGVFDKNPTWTVAHGIREEVLSLASSYASVPAVRELRDRLTVVPRLGLPK